MTTKEIRTAIKAQFGYNSRQVSVKQQTWYGTNLTVRSTNVDVSIIQDFAETLNDCKVEVTNEVFDYNAKNYIESVKAMIPTLEVDCGMNMNNIALLFLDRHECYIDVQIIGRNGESESLVSYHKDNIEQMAYAIAIAEQRVQRDETAPCHNVGDVLVRDYGTPVELTIKSIVIENNRIKYEVETAVETTIESERELKYYLPKAEYVAKIEKAAKEKAEAAAYEKQWSDNNMEYLSVTPCESFDEVCDMNDKVNSLKEHGKDIDRGYSSSQKVRCVGVIEMTNEQYNLYSNDLFRSMEFFNAYELAWASDKYFQGREFTALSETEQDLWRKHSFVESFKVLNIETNEYFYVSNWWNSYARYIFTSQAKETAAVDSSTPQASPTSEVLMFAQR